MTRRPLTAALIGAIALMFALPVSATPTRITVGGTIGGQYAFLSQPSDPAGSLTYLYGSSFSGGGLNVAPSVVFDFTPIFSLQTDLGYSGTWLSGFAEDGVRRINVSITDHALELAVIALLDFDFSAIDLEIGLGPELSVGIAGSLEEEFLNNPVPDGGIDVTTSTWVGLVTQLGVTFESSAVDIPIAARFTWNPAYPDTTADRFDGFVDEDDPGAFILGSDWSMSLSVGVRFQVAGEI